MFRKWMFLAAFLGLQAGAAHAASVTFYGTPAILPSGNLLLNGQTIDLWGIERIAPGQQCLHNNAAWDCGAQATAALLQFIGKYPVRCVLMPGGSGGVAAAQCLRRTAQGEDDIARYLVAEGWARDRAITSGGFYAADENDARSRGLGTWDSSFQGIAPSAMYQAMPDVPPPIIVQNPNVIYSTVVPIGGILVIRGSRDEHHEDHHDEHHDDSHGQAQQQTGHHDDHQGGHHEQRGASSPLVTGTMNGTTIPPLNNSGAKQLNSPQQQPVLLNAAPGAAPNAGSGSAISARTSGGHHDHGSDHDMDKDGR